VSPDLNDLLALRGVAARGLDWRGAPPPGGLAGSHQVALPSAAGRGLQFAESRPYQRGDDVRSIDWKVTARHGRPHTKVFETERERPLWLVIDQGASMQFGSRVSFKSVQAARAAAWLAWSACAGGDRVGGVVLGEQSCRILPPRAGERGVLALLDALCRPAAADAAGLAEKDLAGALAALQPGVRTGDRVAVLSDFYALDTPATARPLATILAALAARCEAVLLQLSDPLEVAPPPAGVYPLACAAGPGWIDLAAPAIRQAWSSPYQQRVEVLTTLARRHGWPVVSLATDGPLASALAVLAGRS
jgi:uncharacterized protein (DUF58 family)